MTDDERHVCNIFVDSLSLLRVDDTGLTADNRLADLNAIAYACKQIQAITTKGHPWIPGDTPEQLALQRLAVLTEHLITTYVFPDEAIVRKWLLARGELLCLRLSVT